MKKNWKLILEGIRECQRRDDKINKQLKELWELMQPESYSPILGFWLRGYMKALRQVLSEEEMDWIEYFANEVPKLEKSAHVWPHAGCKEEKYNFLNINEAVNFLEKYHS